MSRVNYCRVAAEGPGSGWAHCAFSDASWKATSCAVACNTAVWIHAACFRGREREGSPARAAAESTCKPVDADLAEELRSKELLVVVLVSTLLVRSAAATCTVLLLLAMLTAATTCWCIGGGQLCTEILPSRDPWHWQHDWRTNVNSKKSFYTLDIALHRSCC